MGVRDVPVRDRNAALLHRLDIAECVLCEHPVEAREPAVADRVGDRAASRVGNAGASARDRRIDVLGAEERLETVVPAGLIAERVGLCIVVPGANARRILCAVDRDADEVGLRELRIGPCFGELRRRVAEHPRDVPDSLRVGVLELDVGRPDASDITAGPRERDPRRRGVQAAVGDHVRLRVLNRVDDVRPVLERGRAEERRTPRRRVDVVAVRDRLALPIRVETREARQDPARGVRDQDRVVVREQRAVVLEKVVEMRHLLQVRLDIRVVAVEVRVVELEIDHVLDVVVRTRSLPQLTAVRVLVRVSLARRRSRRPGRVCSRVARPSEAEHAEGGDSRHLPSDPHPSPFRA